MPATGLTINPRVFADAPSDFAHNAYSFSNNAQEYRITENK
jgi:hypothetical protein